MSWVLFGSPISINSVFFYEKTLFQFDSSAVLFNGKLSEYFC